MAMRRHTQITVHKMAHPDAIVPPSARYAMPPPDAEIPMTVENLDPTKPVDPRIRGFSSPVDAASYWNRSNGAFRPRNFQFAVQDLWSRGDFCPIAYTIVALSEMISTMRGHGGKLLFATGVPIRNTEDEKRAFAHRGSLRWSLMDYLGSGDPRDHTHMRDLPISGVGAVLGEFAYTSEKMTDSSSTAIIKAVVEMEQGDHERIIVFAHAGYPEMRELQTRFSGVALFADHDGRFPPEAIRAERAILVVGVRGWEGYDRADPERLTNQEKLYALVQMDAAWRFLHLFSPANVERMELETPLDEFPPDLLNVIESYAGRGIRSIAAVRSEYDRMGQAAVEAEDIRKLQLRLGKKRRAPPPPPSDRVTRSRARGKGPSVAFGNDE